MRIFVLFISLFFLSCHNNSFSYYYPATNDYNENNESNDIAFFTGTKAPKDCAKECKKQFVYDLMHDSYLWADKTPVLTKEEFSNIEDDKAMLEALKASNDKYSYILTKKQHDDFFQVGVNRGFGFFPAFVEDENSSRIFIDILLVYPNSPAHKAGLKRGDYISTIDGISSDEIYQNETLVKYYFGNLEENLTITLGLVDLREVNISKSEFKVENVLHKSVINQNSSKVGYLVFQSFIGTSVNELDESFTFFKNHGVDELVLDLRYNGGGYVYVAKYLSSLIGGEKLRGKIFNQTIFNQKYSSFNRVDYFSKIPKNSLNLSRVFVITTKSSCSASELVINSLRANENDVEVIQIGDSTCGKPYGMIGGAYGDNYIFPVQMKSTNGDNVGDYTDGIMPLCSSFDDFNRDFGDIDEDSLASALYYIENSSCERLSRKISPKKESIIDGFRGMYGLF